MSPRRIYVEGPLAEQWPKTHKKITQDRFIRKHWTIQVASNESRSKSHWAPVDRFENSSWKKALLKSEWSAAVCERGVGQWSAGGNSLKSIASALTAVIFSKGCSQVLNLSCQWFCQHRLFNYLNEYFRSCSFSTINNEKSSGNNCGDHILFSISTHLFFLPCKGTNIYTFILS